MERLLLVALLTVVAIGVAIVLRRLRPATGTAVPGDHGWKLPQHVDRADFPRPDAPWLVAVFTSATCSTCASTWAAAGPLESPAVALCEVEYGADRELHEKYGIEGVPAVAIADAEGGVRRWLLGPTSATHLWAAVAEAREPGSVPSCDAD